ncbi:MAG: hypothetical protein HWQ38_33030 [Nostoc sp. NMS7]|nr:hypothetical protein [Nostoc sp. NMS7]MBN3951039.1 hypothetical protein [Nostoc sp. NMS7]
MQLVVFDDSLQTTFTTQHLYFGRDRLTNDLKSLQQATNILPPIAAG